MNGQEDLVVDEKVPKLGFVDEQLHKAFGVCRSPKSLEGLNVEMSGEAIHLAASKGHLEIMKDLLSHKASLQAKAFWHTIVQLVIFEFCAWTLLLVDYPQTLPGNNFAFLQNSSSVLVRIKVYRDAEHYGDVLHAALLCLSEDFARHEAVLRFLLQETRMTLTSTGRHPLHLAATTGKPELMALIRHWMKKQGLNEEDLPSSHEVIVDSKRRSIEIERPLVLAIRSGKMKLKDLVLSADASAFSLKLGVTCRCHCRLPPWRLESIRKLSNKTVWPLYGRLSLLLPLRLLYPQQSSFPNGFVET